MLYFVNTNNMHIIINSSTITHTPLLTLHHYKILPPFLLLYKVTIKQIFQLSETYKKHTEVLDMHN